MALYQLPTVLYSYALRPSSHTNRHAPTTNRPTASVPAFYPELRQHLRDEGLVPLALALWRRDFDGPETSNLVLQMSRSEALAVAFVKEGAVEVGGGQGVQGGSPGKVVRKE